MAQRGEPIGQGLAVEGVAPAPPDTAPGTAAEFVLTAPNGQVKALAGIDSASLRDALDGVEPDPRGRRALLARLASAETAEAVVEEVLALLAETARRIWPTWYDDVSFPGSDDALGRLAAIVAAREAARDIPGLSPSWTKAAAGLALAGRPPRVRGVLPAIEIAQLSLAISRFGLVLVADVETVWRSPNPAATVHALEWIAQHLNGAVIALFHDLPPNAPPFDRILYGARSFSAPAADEPEAEETGPWIAPWRGLPHPASETEQRLARALGEDAELAALFVFNAGVETVRGSRPKVDLVWSEGKLAVELDGWGAHGNRAAFMRDRHRDYELILSGYTVLRLTNDEIALDMEKAIEKIRDLVALCRRRAARETESGANGNADPDALGAARQDRRGGLSERDQAGSEETRP